MKEEKLVLKQVFSTLDTLAGVRNDAGSWIDSEAEEEEEHCVFKIMESIYPFLLANHMFPVEIARIPLDENILLEDLRGVIEIIGKEGFSPSPYLYVREKVEFTDSASLALKLFTMVHKHIAGTDLKTKTEWLGLLEGTSEIIKRGIEFLLKCGHRDKKGLRWSGTPTWKAQKKSFCNVYFTSEAASALSFVLKFYSGILPKELKEKCAAAVSEACLWILGQHKRNALYGDEAMTKGDINYFFYGLNCLFDCFDYLERDQQDKVARLFESFLQEVKDGEEKLSFLTYMDVPLSGYPKPIYYDDRSSIANIITTLCKARDPLRKYSVVNEQFFAALNLYRRVLLELKDPKNDLWDKNNFLLYLNTRAVEALLYFAAFGQAVFYEKVSEQKLLEALKNTLDNPQIQQIFLSEMNRLISLAPIQDDKLKEK